MKYRDIFYLAAIALLCVMLYKSNCSGERMVASQSDLDTLAVLIKTQQSQAAQAIKLASGWKNKADSIETLRQSDSVRLALAENKLKTIKQNEKTYVPYSVSDLQRKFDERFGASRARFYPGK